MDDKRGIAKVIDIESSDLLANMLDYSSFPYKLRSDARLWCVVIRDIYTNEVFTAENEQVTREWLQENLKGCKFLIQHNGIKFDLITLKLFGLLDYSIGYLDQPDTIFGEETKIVDTLIISRLLNPDRFGGHSLGEWGTRTGFKKTDFRGVCISKGYIEKSSPKGSEFKQFCSEMVSYCQDDTEVNKNTFFALMQEIGEYKGWNQAIKMENKLADLAIRRESLGFWFDKELALKCLEDLTEKMETLKNKVNPLLPPKPMSKTELNIFTPPNTQFLKSGKPSTHIIKFAERIGATIRETDDLTYYISFEDKEYQLPFTLPLKTHIEADIGNLDHVKMTLIDKDWIPTEWAIRDFTKDSKKQNLTYEKRVTAFERWLKETQEGKYKKLRLGIAFKDFKAKNIEDLENKIKNRLKEDYPVKLPTSPKVRVGIEKDLCPNLTKLGEKVEFAKDFALYLTYKHRKSSIAGGELEDVDFDNNEAPNSGYLSMYREEDGRVATPAIEIGASSCRYRHIGIANVARASSIYGKEMRSLFGSGKNGLQFGFDFASLEARIQGHYCWKYTEGQELAKSLLAEKPLDIHTLTGLKLGIPRGDAKSVNYMLIYGGKIPKVEAMLGVSKERATEIYDGFWDSVISLKELKQAVTEHWKNNDKKFITGIDGRRIVTRSEHSLLNGCFQSAGVIAAKYVTVLMMQELESKGYNTNPFIAEPDICSMIEYHDECQLYLRKDKNIVKFKTFESEEEAKQFIKSYESETQLSALSEGKKWYVALPNDVSVAVENAMKETERILKLNVSLGYEWIVNTTWYGCH